MSGFCVLQRPQAFLEVRNPSAQLGQQVQIEQAGVLPPRELERVDLRLCVALPVPLKADPRKSFC